MVDRASSYGGQSRASALRSSRSPPRNVSRGAEGTQKTSLSPLRSKIGKQFGASNQPAFQTQQTRDVQEEAMYERRRQQELRRQIQQKEHELETLSQNKERLRNHLGNTGGFSQGSGTITSNYGKKGSNSPLRQNFAKEPSPYRGNVANFGSMNSGRGIDEFGSKARDRTPPTRLQPQPVRDPPRQKSPLSPLRQKSGSPSRKYPMPSSIDPNRVSSSDYLNQLYNDNESLQRRLNLVLQELDRVNRDRGNLIQKYNMCEKEVANMQRQIDGEDMTDKMNGELQVDVISNRDKNKDYKMRIGETDTVRTDAIARLRVLQAERDRKGQIVDEIKGDLQRKHAMIKELEEEQFQNHDRIQNMNAEIERLQRNCMGDDAQNHDIKMIIDRLTTERNDLMSKLDQLNRTYDNCVSEITRERGQMDSHNRHHNKLLVAKVMFQLLEQMFQQRKQDSLNEFFTYCRFDEKCHNTLKQFVKVIDRLGQFKLRIALKQWNQKTFKPIEMQVQNENLTIVFHRRKLLTKYFNEWRNAQMNAGNLYGAKNKALLAIWNSKCKDVKKDVQRAFTIWRDATNFDKLRKMRVKRLVWKCYNNKLAQAWQMWNNYSQELNYQVRLHICAMEFAERQLKQAVFAQIRLATAAMKRKRQQMLRSYLKAWREHNEYRQYMMKSNMTMLAFKKDCNSWLLKRCFDALRQNKEEEKFMLMEQALEGDCQPAIEEMNKQVEKKTKQAVKSGKSRGLQCAKNNINAYMGSYFFHWKKVLAEKDIGINKNLKAMIIKRFMQRQQQAFDLWKQGKNQKNVKMQEMVMEEMEMEGNEMQAQVDSLNVEIKKKENQLVQSGRTATTRAVKICHRRYLKQAMDRWKESKDHKNLSEDRSDFIIQKIRKKYLRQAFDLYKEGVLHTKKNEKNEKSVDQLRATLNERNLRRIFNSWAAYKHQFKNAKRYWTIVFTNMDTWQKKRAFAKWRDQGNVKMVQMMIEEQNQLTEEMTSLEHNVGSLTKKVADKSSRNEAAKQALNKQASRIVTNGLQRAYGGSTGRAFFKWKEWLRCEKHREDTIRKTLYHMKHQQSMILMSCIKLWKNNLGISDQQEALAQMSKEMNDEGLVLNHTEGEYHDEKARLLAETAEANRINEQVLAKHKQFMSHIAFQNHENHYQGRLRYIFTQWAAFTKRQRHFADSITNVIQKSMWQKGLDNIRAFSNDKKLTRNQNKSLDKLRKMFWKRNCGAAISKWRQTEYIQAMEMIEMTHAQTNQTEETHLRRVKKIEKFNFDRSTRIVRKRDKHKYWYAWKNVTKWMKHKRVSTQKLFESMGAYAVKRSIKKWRGRTEATIRARGAYEKFHYWNDIRIKRNCFIQLMSKFQREKALCMKMHTVSRKYDNKNLLSAFQMIQNFVRSKNDVHGHEKTLSSKNVHSVLLRIYRKRMLDYLTHIRLVALNGKKEQSKKLSMIHHCLTRSLRHAFDKWKMQANVMTTVIDVNETGPVVEEVLDHQLDVHNLKALMDKEGFTQNEIDEVADKAQDKGLDLIARAVGRWKHYTYDDDKYLIPKMFDRWRQWVAFRKILRHWLDYIGNRQNHVKADLSHAFNKWKFMASDETKELQKKTLDQLKRRAVLAAKRLEALAANSAQDEDMVNHLSDQNDELFNNYKKSQRLALALWRDNRQMGLRKGYSAMINGASLARVRHLQEIMATNIGAIGALKDKIAEIENDNDQLANENEELRQFSLDGYQLGKNVQNLQHEREALSVDLADKASTIKKLLDENESLSSSLRQAQEKAANLIRSSQAQMGRAR